MILLSPDAGLLLILALAALGTSTLIGALLGELWPYLDSMSFLFLRLLSAKSVRT